MPKGEKKDVFEVSEILKSRHGHDGKEEYFVSWKGFGPSEDCWIPAENMQCPTMLKDFRAKEKSAKASPAKTVPKSESAAPVQGRRPLAQKKTPAKTPTKTPKTPAKSPTKEAKTPVKSTTTGKKRKLEEAGEEVEEVQKKTPAQRKKVPKDTIALLHEKQQQKRTPKSVIKTTNRTFEVQDDDEEEEEVEDEEDHTEERQPATGGIGCSIQ